MPTAGAAHRRFPIEEGTCEEVCFAKHGSIGRICAGVQRIVKFRTRRQGSVCASNSISISRLLIARVRTCVHVILNPALAEASIDFSTGADGNAMQLSPLLVLESAHVLDKHERRQLMRDGWLGEISVDFGITARCYSG